MLWPNIFLPASNAEFIQFHNHSEIGFNFQRQLTSWQTVARSTLVALENLKKNENNSYGMILLRFPNDCLIQLTLILTAWEFKKPFLEKWKQQYLLKTYFQYAFDDNLSVIHVFIKLIFRP
jgi:hypothetical protein